MNDIVEKINESKKIALFTHVSPDGDAIGSIISMYYALKQMNKEVFIYLDEVPGSLSFLCDNIIIDDIYHDADISICLDCADYDRVCSPFKVDNFIINIDHHVSNDKFGALNHVVFGISSCCEILYALYLEMGIDINNLIGSCLCAGIITDSGGFRYSGVTDNTFGIMGDLYKKKIDISDIYYKVFDLKSVARLRIEAISLSRVKYAYDDCVNYTYLENSDFALAGALVGDHEGIVSEIRNVSGVLISFFVREDENGIYKVSFRSKRNVDVNKLASSFDGGGHLTASGCSIKAGSSLEVIEMILSRIGDLYGWNNNSK